VATGLEKIEEAAIEGENIFKECPNFLMAISLNLLTSDNTTISFTKAPVFSIILTTKMVNI
jgi:hypothetical protein